MAAWALAAGVICACLPLYAQPLTPAPGQDPKPNTSQPQPAAQSHTTPADQQAAPASESPTQAPTPANGLTPNVQQRPGGGFKISSEVNLTVLRATVLDKKGRMINDLTKADFEVYEDGAPQ